MERKKGDLLLSWDKKPVGFYLGDFKYYSFGESRAIAVRCQKRFKLMFYTEESFESADLAGADLSFANLKGANLKGANLSGADLTGADLTGIKYNKNTIWPEGFKP